jgi:DNA-binding response OmpR family regulator
MAKERFEQRDQGVEVKILLIEDSRFQRVANERALIKAGYSVITAGDGEEGVRAALENSPDLILLDMMLPKVSGLDVLRALKGDALVKHIPVIVLSGLGQANEAKLLKEGATAFLVKSEKWLENNSSMLIQAVERALYEAKTQV